jgi:hypothetical protein
MRLKVLVLCGAATLSAALIYGVWVEPYSIEVTRYRLRARVNRQLKIAHLTDLHTSGLGRRERELIRILEAERPDVIFITGDNINSRGDYGACRQVLSRLRAPLGVWAVRGNWEIWRPASDERAFYEGSGVKLLINEAGRVREDVWVIGFDDALAGEPDREALSKAPGGPFQVALFHSPVYFERVSGRCDLALAGHTHGGQIRLPFLGSLWLPPGSGNFSNGWYEANGSRMYVSRGIGTSIVGIRLFCRPELAIITLCGDC